MATETRNKGTIYCTKEQFDTLMSTGSVVIGGQTFTYEDGWQYAVVDKDYVDLTSDQGVEGTKTFVDSANNKSIGINGSGFIYQTGNNSYNISLPAGSGTLALTGQGGAIYHHYVTVSDQGATTAVMFEVYSSGDYINTVATLVEALGIDAPLSPSIILAGSTASGDFPEPATIQLTYAGGVCECRYRVAGAGSPSSFDVYHVTATTVEL